ncbi:MAG: DNA cytosine methyltransferase [Muribaculum sp.]|nr:DNA cytosine methyltransferase [Muribaculum sp.]
MSKDIKFIDLFAGIGGIRTGLSQALCEKGYIPKCVLTSEIKPYAIKVLKANYDQENIVGDITQVHSSDIPDFDILCAGFPCQAFSSAGKRQGFADTRGTLFFEVERILKEKKPKGFILENVEGLVNHDGGRTLDVILTKLREIGYKVSYKVLNSAEFGVPQERKRIYIVGTFGNAPLLSDFDRSFKTVGEILEKGKPSSETPFIKSLLSHFSIEELYGKSIKDKRGGDSNIHSWDLEMKGSVSPEQRDLLNQILRERRKKKWAEEYGIDWMDGMPLTFAQIKSFFPSPRLQEMLDDLTGKGYLKYEHPKRRVAVTDIFGNTTTARQQDPSLPKGYNIVAGKLSFEISKVLGPNEVAPTLVAMDMQKIYVADNGGLRKLTLREGLRLFGYPETMNLPVSEKDGYDLLGNTVVVPVIKAVAHRLIDELNL